MPSIRTRRSLRTVAGLVIAAAFLYLTVRHLAWGAIRTTWRSALLGPIALGVVALAAGYAVRIARWWLMLRAIEPTLPYRACVRPFLGSVAVNNTLPLRAGDVVRAFAFRGALRASAGQVIGTLVVERVLDMVVLLALFFAGLIGVARGAVPESFVTTGRALFVLAAALLVTLVLAPRLVERALRAMVLAPLARRGGMVGRVATRTGAVAEPFFTSFAQVLTPGRAVTLLALSVAAWVLEGGLYLGVAAALHARAPVAGAMFALSTGTLATLLPSSPGFVGTFDYFAAVGLAAYGATRTVAAAFALLTHFLLWLLPTAAGAVSLASLRRRAAPSATPDALAVPPA